MSDIELILERLDGLEKSWQNHMNMCQQLCLSKIDAVEKSANKAHERLDRQKDTIGCISDWKNQMKGRMWAIPIVMGPITAVLTLAVIKLFGG